MIFLENNGKISKLTTGAPLTITHSPVKLWDMAGWSVDGLEALVNSTPYQVEFSDNSAALQSQITTLNSQITTLNADKAALQTQVNSLNAQITTLNADKAALQTQVNSLISTNATLTASNATLTNTIASLDDNMTFYYNGLGTTAFSVSCWLLTNLANDTVVAYIQSLNHLTELHSTNGLYMDNVLKTSNPNNTWVFWQWIRSGSTLYSYKNGSLVGSYTVGLSQSVTSCYIKRVTGCLIANLIYSTSTTVLSPPTRET
jgi:prefoldin subunit 5